MRFDLILRSALLALITLSAPFGAAPAITLNTLGVGRSFYRGVVR